MTLWIIACFMENNQAAPGKNSVVTNSEQSLSDRPLSISA